MTKSRLTRSAAVLEVSDVVKSVAWYCDVLGFGSHSFWGEPPCFCIVGRASVSIFLDQSRTRRTIPLNQYWAAYVYVDDIDTLYKEYRSKGVDIARELEATEYGCRDFDVRDPDGHIIGFGQVLEPRPDGSSLS